MPYNCVLGKKKKRTRSMFRRIHFDVQKHHQKETGALLKSCQQAQCHVFFSVEYLADLNTHFRWWQRHWLDHMMSDQSCDWSPTSMCIVGSDLERSPHADDLPALGPRSRPTHCHGESQRPRSVWGTTDSCYSSTTELERRKTMHTWY